MKKTATASRNNNLSMKAKIAMLLIIPLIVITVSSVAIVMTAKTLVPDEVYEALVNTQTEYVLPLATQEDEIFGQLLQLLTEVEQSSTVRIETGLTLDMDESTLQGNMSQAQKNLLTHFEDGMKEQFRRTYDCITTDEQTQEIKGICVDYGEKTEVMPKASLLTQYEKATCEQDKNYYKYNITLPTAIGEQFYAQEHEKQLNTLKTAFADVLTVNGNSSVSLTKTEIIAKADAKTGRLTNVDFVKYYDVSLSVTFVNDFAALGEQEIGFSFKVKHNNTVKFAGITITDEKIVINKNGYQALNLITNVSELASAEDYTLTFTSSDESICTVSQTGTVEAVGKESDAPVTVKATLQYLGNTYEAQCPVWVITQADGIKISESEIELKQNETFALSAEVTPKKATVKDVLWYSSDETVCSVDENGLVSAHGQGVAQVIAVSKDGNYMEECHIRVAE